MGNYSILISAAANEDLQDGILWYEQQQDNLGVQFESDVFETFERIQSFPSAHSMVLDKAQARKARLSKFKHSILFVIREATKTIEVMGIFHDAQDPKRYEERLG